MQIYSNYTETGNRAIDMCANLIASGRKTNQPIKALHLSPIYYDWYKSGVQTLLNRPLEKGEDMQFDGVNIEKGTIYQMKSVVIEYYKPLAES
jgi:hypothetical protein